MADRLQEIIYELLKGHSAPESATSRFRSLKHDRDLLPEIKGRIDRIIRSYGNYSNATYDIQGITDKGVDLIAQYNTGEDKNRYIGFQVKSFDDIEKDDWFMKLKAQILEAGTFYVLEDYYIILCTDSRKHKKKLSTAKADLVKIKNMKIQIVEPKEAIWFLGRLDHVFEAIVRAYFFPEDGLVIDLKDRFSEFTLFQASLIIEGACQTIIDGIENFTIEDLYQSNFCVSVLDSYPNIVIDRYQLTRGKPKIELPPIVIADEWEAIESNFQTTNDLVGRFLYKLESDWALSSIIVEARARDSLSDYEIRQYVLQLIMEETLDMAERYAINRRWKENSIFYG